MATVNEDFDENEDIKEKREEEEPESPKELVGDVLNVEIDYSEARKAPLFFAAISASWGAFILGTFIGWSSPFQPQLQHVANATVPPKVTDPDNIWYMKLTDTEMSIVGSFVNLGALFGSLAAGYLMDGFGRKFTLIVMSLPFVIGWLLIIVAVDPSMLYIGRFLGGFAGGICSVVSPTFIGEFAIPSLRGALGFAFQLMVVSGILITSIFGLWVDWRLISAIMAVFPVIFVLSMIYIPESPYYLIKKGKSSEARAAMKWFRGPEYNMESELAQMEIRVRIELSQISRFSDLWSSSAWKPVLVAMGLMAFQQLSGVNAALYNSVVIFESAGSELDPLVCAILLNVDQVVVCLISSLLVERLGRRTLFFISETLMTISLFLLGGFFYIKEDNSSQTDPEKFAAFDWLPLASLILFMAAYSIGVGPMPWLMSGEILPAKVKGVGSSVACFVNWGLAFVVTLTFVDITNAIGNSGAFWMFGSFCILSIVFTIFLVPETKDKTPEQIQAFFGNHPPVRSVINNST